MRGPCKRGELLGSAGSRSAGERAVFGQFGSAEVGERLSPTRRFHRSCNTAVEIYILHITTNSRVLASSADGEVLPGCNLQKAGIVEKDDLVKAYRALKVL